MVRVAQMYWPSSSKVTCTAAGELVLEALFMEDTASRSVSLREREPAAPMAEPTPAPAIQAGPKPAAADRKDHTAKKIAGGHDTHSWGLDG
jgi:hypothetical protein